MGKVDTIGVSLAIDWEMLRNQKQAMVDILGFIRHHSPQELDGMDQRHMDAVEGVLGVLDTCQDQAAETLGEEYVFGPQEAD